MARSSTVVTDSEDLAALSRSMDSCEIITSYCRQIGEKLLSGQALDRYDFSTLNILDGAVVSNMDAAERAVVLVNQALALSPVCAVSYRSYTDCKDCQDQGIAPCQASHGTDIEQEQFEEEDASRSTMLSIEEVPSGQQAYLLGLREWCLVHLLQGRMLTEELNALRTGLGNRPLWDRLLSSVEKQVECEKVEVKSDGE